jgi:glycosyltransferase involved in cell wall biosynthesis
MRRVLHLIQKYPGNSPLLNDYVKALPVDLFCSLVCYLQGSPDGENGIENIASDVRYLEFENRNSGFTLPGAVYAIYKIIKSEKIDIVHCHRHKATVIGALASAIAGVSEVISHVHGLTRTRTRKRYITNWILFKRVKKIIAVSDSVRKDIIRTNLNLNPEKVVTVRNGIDLGLIDSINTTRKDARLKLGLPDDTITFGTVGRLTRTKGQSYLLEAFSKILEQIHDARLVLIGEGPLSEELRRQAGNLNISSKILFTGYRNDVRELLKGLDVFVLPSVAEGLSIALLEAMASRLPVIASNVGGIPEVIDCNSGFLLPARDSSVLAEAMKKFALLKNKERIIIGNSARKRVEEAFTTEIMQQNISELYASLIGS